MERNAVIREMAEEPIAPKESNGREKERIAVIFGAVLLAALGFAVWLSSSESDSWTSVQKQAARWHVTVSDVYLSKGDFDKAKEHQRRAYELLPGR